LKDLIKKSILKYLNFFVWMQVDTGFESKCFELIRSEPNHQTT